MSIPEWSYSPEYYEQLLVGEQVEIKTDPVKGKGLFAKRAFDKDDRVLCETAMCCTQNLDDTVRELPVCANCLVSLETPKEIVRRVCGDRRKDLVRAMPVIDGYIPRVPEVIDCKFLDAGCKTKFCSYRCRDMAWKHSHFAACVGRMSSDANAAYHAFLGHTWTQGGIDYSDTHLLSLRFVSFVLTRHRLHGMPLPQAFLPVGQLIRAPIKKFCFSYLLVDDYEEAEKITYVNEEDKAVRRFAHFEKFKTAEGNTGDPVVTLAHKSGPTKSEMIGMATSLIRTMFQLDAEEAAFLSEDLWSDLLGAVLLNGQERSPNSPYTDMHEVAKKTGNSQTMKTFHTLIRSAGVEPTKFDGSTRGQGIYMIGACFNHSCEPNVQVTYVDGSDETLVVVALRDIACGEELFISYIDEHARFEDRQQHLFEHYLFNCTCTKCSREKLLRHAAVEALAAAPAKSESSEADAAA